MKECWLKIKQYFIQEEEVFAKGVCGKKLFIIFVIASIFGAYYEQILNLIKYYLADGSIFWEPRTGVFYGPFSPIYGMGAVLVVYLFAKKDRPWYQILLYGSLLGGAFEFLISFLQETFIGTISWDYSNHFLNIAGRTTIPFMLAWGVMIFILVKVVYPFLSERIEAIPSRLGNIVYLCLVIFLTLDMLISWTALIRGALRRKEYPPVTPIGQFYDRIYPDQYLQKKFPNMNFEPDKGEK